MINFNHIDMNFRKISQAIESTTISSPQQPQKPEPVEQIYNGNSAEYFVACYPYESTEPDDLTFNVGEMILVTKKDGDWWVGAIGSRSGIFPANYVQKAEESNEHIYSEPPLEVSNESVLILVKCCVGMVCVFSFFLPAID